jgi:hypothetical protein
VQPAATAESIADAQRVLPVRLVQLHVVIMILVEVLFRVANFGGLFQVLSALSQLRFATLFALGYVVLVQRRGAPWFALLCGFEVLQSLGGFFAGFRLPIYVAFLATATSTGRFDVRRVLAVVGLGAMALYLGIIWQSIKGEYRDVANAGSGEQAVVIDRGEQMSTLLELWQSANEDILIRGSDNLARRLAYVDFLAFTVQFVPDTRPHEEGRVWGGALRHVLIPRLVWPDKPELYADTEFTRDFTGLSLYSANRDTSISIGWVGDAWIDFGLPGVIGISFLLGVLGGLLYRSLCHLNRGLRPLRYGAAVAVLLTMAEFGLSSPKVLGGLLSVYLVGIAGTYYLIEPISVWLTLGRWRPAPPPGQEGSSAESLR